MWNCFSVPLWHVFRLWQSKERRMECKFCCSIQLVPSLGIMVSHILRFCQHSWQTNYWKHFKVVFMYLNKNIIITKKSYKEWGEKLLLGHKNEVINIYSTMNWFTQFICSICRTHFYLLNCIICAIDRPWKGDQRTNYRFLFPSIRVKSQMYLHATFDTDKRA